MELSLKTLAERVEVLERRLAQLAPVSDPPGTTGDKQSDDPEAIARWLAAFDAIPPLQMTADEEVAWQAARAAQKHSDTVAFDRLATSLRETVG